MSDIIDPNTGKVVELSYGELLIITSRSAVDVLLYCADDFKIRLSTCRTKAHTRNIFAPVGTGLYSNDNRVLATIEADTYAGRHDLQYDMCSKKSYDTRFSQIESHSLNAKKRVDFPDHGCWENLSSAFEPFGIVGNDLPLPLNLFQSMDVQVDGVLVRKVDQFRPGPSGSTVSLRAECDLLVGVSACPELFRTGGQVELNVEPVAFP